MAYHQHTTEEKKEMLSNFNTGFLEDRIFDLCGSDCVIDKIIRELIPNYFKIKLPDLNIIFIHLRTNETGNQIKVFVFPIDIISIETIALITAVFDLITVANSPNWEPFCFKKENICVLHEGKEIIKYSFSSTNLSNCENFAAKSVFVRADF